MKLLPGAIVKGQSSCISVLFTFIMSINYYCESQFPSQQPRKFILKEKAKKCFILRKIKILLLFTKQNRFLLFKKKYSGVLQQYVISEVVIQLLIEKVGEIKCM